MTLDDRLDAARRDYLDQTWVAPFAPAAENALAAGASADHRGRRRSAARVGAVAAAVTMLIGAGWLAVSRNPPQLIEVVPATTTAAPRPVGPVEPRWDHSDTMSGHGITEAVASDGRLYVGYRTIDMRQELSAGGVAVIDLATGHLMTDHGVPGAVGRGGIAIAGGKVWFTTTNDRDPGETALYALAEQDGASPEKIDVVDAGTTLAAHDDRVWVHRSAEVQTRDARDGHVLSSTPASGPGWVATDGTSTWTSTPGQSLLSRISPTARESILVDRAAGSIQDLHVAGGIVWIEQGPSVTLFDARRERVLGPLTLGVGGPRDIVDSDMAGSVLWVLTANDAVVAIDTATGTRHVMDADDNWGEGLVTLTALSDRVAIICSGTDTVQSYCRPYSTDGTIPTTPSSRPSFHPVTVGPEQLASFRAKVTATDAIIDRRYPETIGSVAASTDVVIAGHVIGAGGPRVEPFLLIPDQASFPNGDLVSESLVLYVRVDRVDHRRALAGQVQVAAGDVIAVPSTVGMGARAQSPDRLAAVREAIAEAPIGGRITIPLEVVTPDTGFLVVDLLRSSDRPFLSLSDGTHVTPLETSLDAVVATRTLDDVTTELVTAVQARG